MLCQDKGGEYEGGLGSVMRSPIRGTAENDFGAYLEFRERFLEQLSLNIINIDTTLHPQKNLYLHDLINK